MNDYQTPSYDSSQLNPYDYEGTSSRRGKGCRNWAIGCAVVLLFMLGMMAVGGFYIAKNFRPWTAEAVVAGVEEGIENVDLPDDQKQQIVARVRELGDDFAKGDITLEEMGEIAENIIESRTIIAGGVEFIIRKTVDDKLELDEERKDAVKRLVQRLSRGIIEEKLDEDDFKPLMEIVFEKTGEDKYEMKEDLTKEEIEQFLTELQTLVDEAEIPDEPYEVNLADELDRIIDDVRGDN
jgi:hypothetical protein